MSRDRALQIVVAVHGRGRGHATRAATIIDALREAGHDVRVVAGGAAIDLFPGEASLRCVETVAPGPRLLRRMRSRVVDDRRALAAHRPDLLVTDGDAPSSLAARSLGIPVVAVGHGLVFAHCDAGPLPVLPHLREALNALSASLFASRRVAVHFGSARAREASTRVARADVGPLLDRDAPVRDHVVAYFRDDGGDAWLEELVRRGERVVLFSRRDAAPRGVELVVPDVAAFASMLTTSKGALGTAGSNLVAECAFLGVPLLALPSSDDVEQRLNAKLLQNSGIGIAATLDRFDAAAVGRFTRACRNVLDEGRGANLLPNAPGAAASVVAAVHELGLRPVA